MRFIAGIPKPPPPLRKAHASSVSWKRTPAKTSPSPKSAAETVATTPLLACPDPRAFALIPLTGISPGLEDAAITSPPGHMQKE
jgi:hypothetical protein